MLRNQLKFFVRIFLKDKFFSTLNILGLALGIAVSIILLLILQNDLTYDQYHVKHKRIFRLGGHLQATGVDSRRARTSRELGVILKEELPEVQVVVRANNWDHTLVKYESKGGEKAFYEEDIVRTDSTYFQVFTHQFIAGDPYTCLTDLNTLVVTESTAKKYFGDEDPINKSLIIDNQPWKVTAVIKDLPENTHLKFDILLSRLVDREWVVDKGQIKSEAFWNPDVYMYLLMPEHYNPNDFERKFASIFNKYFKAFGDQVGGKYTPILEPLADIHFHSDLDSDEPHGNIAYLYAFTGIGVFIILLACINYMNLSTAKSVTRATEIAMKKTLGSGKRSLVVSFLGESVFLSFISLALAIVLVFVVLRLTSFNQLIDKNLAPDFLHNPLLLFGSLGISLGIGIISGLYPAFYLSSLHPVKVLKGSHKVGSNALLFRKGLVVFQFALSIILIVVTLIMSQQIHFVANKNLGFDKESLIYIPFQGDLDKKYSVFRQRLATLPGIKAVSRMDQPPSYTGAHAYDMEWEGKDPDTKTVVIHVTVGYGFLKLMNLTLLQGRDFSEDFPSDLTTDSTSSYIINETAVKMIGYKDPIGKPLGIFQHHGKIIGVVKDFNFKSLREPIEPLLINLDERTNWGGGYVLIKTEPGKTRHERLDHVESRRGRCRGIEGVSAACQHLGASLRGQRMRGRDHAVH